MSRARIVVVEPDGGAPLGRDLDRLLAGQFELSHLSGECFRSPADVSGAPQPAAVLWIESQEAEGSTLEAVRGRYPAVPIVLVADRLPAERISKLLESGVCDYVMPPLRETELLPRLWRLARRRSSRRSGPDAAHARRRLKEKLGLRQLVGESQPFLDAIAKVPLFARYDGNVLIEGETGTGKGVVARAIHHLGARSNKPFIPVNCGALPSQLMENELFGHAVGAYTGASSARTGLVDEASGGTLFLDEIDCLSLAAQGKLLRLLQERDYRPLGAGRPRKADIRVIVSTNIDLTEAVRKREVREDLYYRIHVLPLCLPPLRRRDEDILLLARHFLTLHSKRLQRQPPTLLPEATLAMMLHDWPGNVRELEHVIERAIVMADGRETIEAADLLLGPAESSVTSFREAKARVVRDFERAFVRRALAVNDGNVTRAAAYAGKNRRAFWELMRKHGIETVAESRGVARGKLPPVSVER